MKKFKNYILIILAVATLWHIIVASNDKIRLSGLFNSKPENGYTWEGTESNGSRFLWLNTDVNWKEGITHQDFNVESAKREGVWNPLPGYKFMDESKGLTTVWKEGLLHPYFKAFSEHGEGLWKPATGYKFLYEGDTFSETVWDPLKKYEEQKVISLQQQDSFKPFPGYRFVDKGNSLQVAWTPGMINSDNHKLIAGRKEGTWDINYQPQRATSSDDDDYKKVLVGLVAINALNSL
jgi:hypothetical protein